MAAHVELRGHFQLPGLVDRQAQRGEKGRRPDAGGPDADLVAVAVAGGVDHPLRLDLRHPASRHDLDMPLFQQRRGGQRHPLRQRRQNARCAFEQGDADIVDRIELAEAIIDIALARLAQLGRQLDAGGATADDDDVDAVRCMPALLAVLGLRHVLEHFQTEALRVTGAVERNGVLGRARRVEIMRGAADGDTQARKRQGALGHGHGTGRILDSGDDDALIDRVEPGEHAIHEGEVVLVRQHGVRQALLVHVHRAGSDLVQRRLPDMVKRLVDQRHARAAQFAAQFAGQLQAAGATADDHDIVELGIMHGVFLTPPSGRRRHCG